MTSFLAKVARAVAAVALGFGGGGPARAVALKVSSTGGVMQQPTSHYYHAVYGGIVEVASDSGSLTLRGQYVERPEFTNAGFSDKDYGAFILVGTKVTKSKDHGLYAFFGAGRMQGYVRADAETRDQVQVDQRSYALPGPTMALEYAFHWRYLDLGVNHQTFIGYVDHVQTDAYVAWPFNFFQATAGVTW